MNPLHRAATRLGDFASQPRMLIGASMFRLVAGAGILAQYLATYAQRRFLFGPDGIYPFDLFLKTRGWFSLYRLSPGVPYFELVYHLGLVVAFLWFVGYRTRITTPLLLVFWMSLHERYALIWDGGDNVLQLALFYACFADVSAFFSVDADRPRRPAGSAVWVLHGAAMLAMALQISLVYFNAGVAKIHGVTWVNGTALYYVFRATEFKLSGFSDWMARQAGLQVFLCYATLGFQISFPWLVFLNRRSRVAAIAIGLLFHLGILIGMGLVSFAMFMMAVDLAVVTDDEYRDVARWIRSCWRLAVRARRTKEPSAQEAPRLALGHSSFNGKEDVS